MKVRVGSNAKRRSRRLLAVSSLLVVALVAVWASAAFADGAAADPDAAVAGTSSGMWRPAVMIGALLVSAWALLRYLRGRGARLGFGADPDLNVVSTVRVAGKWDVALVQVMGRHYLVGGGGAGVNMLADVTDGADERYGSGGGGGASDASAASAIASAEIAATADARARFDSVLEGQAFGVEPGMVNQQLDDDALEADPVYPDEELEESFFGTESSEHGAVSEWADAGIPSATAAPAHVPVPVEAPPGASAAVSRAATGMNIEELAALRAASGRLGGGVATTRQATSHRATSYQAGPATARTPAAAPGARDGDGRRTKLADEAASELALIRQRLARYRANQEGTGVDWADA